MSGSKSQQHIRKHCKKIKNEYYKYSRKAFKTIFLVDSLTVSNSCYLRPNSYESLKINRQVTIQVIIFKTAIKCMVSCFQSLEAEDTLNLF